MNARQLKPSPRINEIASLLVPVNGKLLVLPNVTVAEIVPYQDPMPEDDRPGWYLGRLDWRTQSVPVVSFEGINDEPFISASPHRRIAILNNVTGDPGLPFCALVTEGAPRLMRVMADEVLDDPDATPGPAEVARILVAGERASIPDVAFIQQQVAALLGASL
ncbi:MAG TPA: chemotaxis protein CheW [Spongiibacteraceae bacterium]|jgi:chemosensory pili system protein ChpC|nr:chemotaxis protein CheW [Spongiibacteraceae bacterium]HUH36757.1 chemotaxis protein CheW [Spongiibacteraceae bacterium]